MTDAEFDILITLVTRELDVINGQDPIDTAYCDTVTSLLIQLLRLRKICEI